MKRSRAATWGLAFCALMVTAARTKGARGILRTAATGLTATALMVKEELQAAAAKTMEAAQDFGAEVTFRRAAQPADREQGQGRLVAEEPAQPPVTDVNEGKCKPGA